MSSGGKRRGVRRGREAEDHENEAPQQPGIGVNDVNAVAQKVNPSKTFTFNRAYAEFPEKLIAIPAVGNKDAKLWEEQLLDDAQDNCVRRVLRLFLTKGAKGDVIRKADVLKILKEIDPTYSAVANSVLKVVKDELKNTFGYNVTTRADPRTKNDSEFILFNSLRSPQLQDILADSASQHRSAWIGFVFVVLQIINSSAGKSIDAAALMAKVRELDDRFPDTVSKSTSSRAPVPELGADFPSLMKRMVNERYVVVKTEGGSASSSAAANKDEAKVSYTFGPRFFAEFGRRQLLTSYYDALGQVVDVTMLDEAANAEKEQNDLVDDDEEEEEENGEAEGDGPDGEKDKGGEDAPPPAPAPVKRKKSRIK